MTAKRSDAVPAHAPVDRYAKYEGDANFVVSLARGLSIVESFENRPHGVTISDVAKNHRLLACRCAAHLDDTLRAGIRTMHYARLTP